MRDEKCCLSWWFPKLEAAGIPVPKTEMIRRLARRAHHVLGSGGDS